MDRSYEAGKPASNVDKFIVELKLVCTPTIKNLVHIASQLKNFHRATFRSFSVIQLWAQFN